MPRLIARSFFFSSRRRHTRWPRDWSSDVCSSDLSIDSAGPANDKLTAARARIAEKNWPAAIEELNKVNDAGSADWNNLMGYSMRKQATPDYAAAERYYNEALRIDPKHRGALEYSGELYLMTGELPKAEERLAALDKACRFSC